MNSTAKRVPFTTGFPTRMSGSSTIRSRQSMVFLPAILLAANVVAGLGGLYPSVHHLIIPYSMDCFYRNAIVVPRECEAIIFLTCHKSCPY